MISPMQEVCFAFIRGFVSSIVDDYSNKQIREEYYED